MGQNWRKIFKPVSFKAELRQNKPAHPAFAKFLFIYIMNGKCTCFTVINLMAGSISIILNFSISFIYPLELIPKPI